MKEEEKKKRKKRNFRKKYENVLFDSIEIFLMIVITQILLSF